MAIFHTGGVSWGGWWVRVRVSGGVVGGFLAVGKYGHLPHRCGDSAVPWQHLDRTVWAAR